MAIKCVPVPSRRRRVALVCAVCGCNYMQHEYRAATSKFCSKACWARRNPPAVRQCGYCKKDFNSRDKTAKFCSRRCSRKVRVGPLASHWKGGKSLHDERARLMPERREWCRAVFRRDGFKCVRCGNGGRLHGHHIKGWADFPELRFVVENGETLCEVCHGDEHGIDFTHRRIKTCKSCGRKTKGRSKYQLCKSCAITKWHAEPPSSRQTSFLFLQEQADDQLALPTADI